jgi:hypothetical protein
MIETHQLYAAAVDALGAKRVRDELNVGLQHVYKLAADPMTQDVPVRDDVARITSLVDALAARPHAKPALILWRLYFSDMFARAVDRQTVMPLDKCNVAEHVGKICREFAEMMLKLSNGDELDPDVITKEAADVIAAVERLVRCAEAADDAPKLRSVR